MSFYYFAQKENVLASEFPPKTSKHGAVWQNRCSQKSRMRGRKRTDKCRCVNVLRAALPAWGREGRLLSWSTAGAVLGGCTLLTSGCTGGSSGSTVITEPPFR